MLPQIRSPVPDHVYGFLIIKYEAPVTDMLFGKILTLLRTNVNQKYLPYVSNST
jgi:hypothetical protein